MICNSFLLTNLCNQTLVRHLLNRHSRCRYWFGRLIESIVTDATLFIVLAFVPFRFYMF
ncbi:hypothetical protein Hdeb2414_s0003g00110071 [Helianthus debilis subsp. tardiflorus]